MSLPTPMEAVTVPRNAVLSEEAATALAYFTKAVAQETGEAHYGTDVPAEWVEQTAAELHVFLSTLLADGFQVASLGQRVEWGFADAAEDGRT
jgi:hypothetical protein